MRVSSVSSAGVRELEKGTGSTLSVVSGIVWPVNALAFHPINTFTTGGLDAFGLRQQTRSNGPLAVPVFLADRASYMWDAGEECARVTKLVLVLLRERLGEIRKRTFTWLAGAGLCQVSHSFMYPKGRGAS